MATGKIFLLPREISAAAGLRAQTGADIQIGGDQLSRDIVRGEGTPGGRGGGTTKSSGPSAQALRTKQRNDTRLQGQNLITKLNKEFKDKVRKREFGDRNALLNAQKELRSKTQNISKNIKNISAQIGSASLSDLKTQKFNINTGETTSSPSQQTFIQEKQIGTFRGVPSTELVITNKVGVFQRKPTAEEIKLFRARPKELQASVLGPVKSKIKILQKTFKESTPELSFLGKSKEAKVIRDLVGIGFGTERFLRENAKQKLLELEGADGNRIFTPTQASKLTDLILEVSENVALGAGAGKVISLGRVGVKKIASKIIPKGIRGSKKLSKIGKFTEVAVGIGLVGSELNRVRKTFKDKGEDAAILQLLGLTSFGVGFGKTGLRSTAQTEKQLKQLSSKFKKSIPRDKRGELFRKRKKKKRLSDQELITIEQAEQQIAAEAAVEREVIKKKGLKEQLEILSKLKSKLKTPTQKANFKRFVTSLVEKNILKVPKAEIIPGVTVKAIPQFSKGVSFTTKKVRPLEVTRTNKAKIKQKERVKFSQRSLSDRFKQAQRSVVSLASKSSQKQLQKLKTSQLQISSQKTKQTQQQKLKTAQLSAPLTKQVQLQKLKLKSLVRSRTPSRLKSIFRLPFIKVPKLIFPDSRKGRRKGKIVPSFLSGEKGHNVFVKAKGKFKKVNLAVLGKRKAENLGAWLVDKSTSRSYRIKPTSKLPKKPKLIVPNNYFGSTRKKFRGRILKGKAQPLRRFGVRIERSKHAIDSFQEKKQLSVARVRKQLIDRRKRTIKNKPSKLKSTGFFKRRRR